MRNFFASLFRRRRPGPDWRGAEPADTYYDDEYLAGPESPPWSDAVPMQLPREAPYGYAPEDAVWPRPGEAPAQRGAPSQSSRERPAPTARDSAKTPPKSLPKSPAKTPPKAQAKEPAKASAKRKAGTGPLPGLEGILAVDAVEKSYRGRKVVRGVSLYVREGEAVGLLGPNGAGKTTVFYMTTGLVKADAGRIFLHGYDITQMPMYRRARLGIGYLPQEPSIFRGLNVEDNIRAVLEVVEPNRRKREEELDALLDEFGIARLRKSPSIALSGGERRRCEIARALATRPSFMLLDEPFAGIDPIAVGDIQALVRHLTRRGIGVLITDHNVRETLGLIDRAYIIHSGEVLMEGSAEDIVSSPDVRRLYLGEEFRL